MKFTRQHLDDHIKLTRRFFLQAGAMGVAGLNVLPLCSDGVSTEDILKKLQVELDYLTADKDFINYGRGKPPPDKLPIEKRREVGLTRETWKLEAFVDPESDSEIERPLLKEQRTAFTWDDLMKLAQEKSVRFMSAMSCTNGRKPCGMGLWEGVPLREVVWLSNPKKNVRRVYYYGFHNDDPAQRFQSSLTLSRILEDPPGHPPVILCYKLNNRWLTPVRGGPVRIIVPELYGNKSVKWIQRIVFTNDYKVNDTYALWNNDTESHLKTWACFVHVPKTGKPGTPLAVTGLAQSGMSGLSQVQYCLHRKNVPYAKDDPHFTRMDWKNAEILPPPQNWGSELSGGKLPPVPAQIDSHTGQPHQWPLPNTLIHWAAVLRDVPPGQYDILCRTIDSNGAAQPMPRPYLKSGYNAIQKKSIHIEM